MIHLHCPRKFVTLPVSPGYHSQREIALEIEKKAHVIYDNEMK